MPGASIVVKDKRILGIGANGSDYHKKYPCKRRELKCKTGEGYELCEGCHPKNHSEPTAICDAEGKGNDTRRADLYLWGHWWCCEPCWDAMEEASIGNVYLLEDSEKLFNKDHPENIVGKQFEERRYPMKVFVFETQGKYRSGDVKVILANSREEAEKLLVDDDLKTITGGMSHGVPSLTDAVILKDWTCVKEETVTKKGIIWKQSGIMIA